MVPSGLADRMPLPTNRPAQGGRRSEARRCSRLRRAGGPVGRGVTLFPVRVGRLFVFVEGDREDLGGDVLGLELGASRVKVSGGLVEPVGENAEKLPEELDREL